VIEPLGASQIITPVGAVGPAVISFHADGRIASIDSTDQPVPELTLVPGFIDLQVNGIDDVDVARTDGEDWLRLGELLLDQGTTAWCPTLVTAPLDRYPDRLARLQRAIDQQRPDQPTILGAHLEGPFLGGAPGAHPTSLIIPIDLDWLANLPPFIRLVTVAAESPGAPEATRLLVERGITVSIGHSTPTAEQLEACIDAGATMVTHLFNGMSGVHHRQGGLALAALTDSRLVAGLIADGIHVNLAALQLAATAKGDEGIALVTDAVGWRRGSAGEVHLSMTDGAPRLADGTLAGSSLTMDAAIRRMVNEVGVPLHEAIAMATATPAHVLNESQRGALRPGLRGDVVALDEHLSISGVWLSGSRVR
jgi:N-acetylglucosamine-6-phosphate deacetylase